MTLNYGNVCCGCSNLIWIRLDSSTKNIYCRIKRDNCFAAVIFTMIIFVKFMNK